MDFARHLADLIRHDGPMRLDRFMGLANAHYYATRDPLGAGGDFVTSPEISQLFGEMIGLCLVDFWERSGSPSPIRLVELGPGRGTLMADLLRAAKLRPAFLKAAQITLVETSPALRARQRAALATHDVTWADAFDGVADDAPLYLVANEFFDALPIRQFVPMHGGWCEHFVACKDDGALELIALPSLAPPVIPGEPGKAPRPAIQGQQAPVPEAAGCRVLGACGGLARDGNNAVREVNEAAAQIGVLIGARLKRNRGVALIIDYGHFRTAFGNTLQAVKAHRFADVLAGAGEADLTAHVDFEALSRAGGVEARIATQGELLGALGIQARAAALSRARPDQAPAIAAAVARLTAPDQMGTLFKAMALTGPGAPIPAGFAP
jgi:NADH dehydrogenase [ubiquinone] 1 alpha subcomplex assembly factor 7